MMSTVSLIEELRRESVATRAVLERVPEEKLTWRPHEKSMTLGQLALHVAMLPRGIAELATELVREAPNFPQPQPESCAQVLATLDDSVEHAAAKLGAWGDEGLAATWKLVMEGRTIFEMPRGAVIRTIMLNHTYHHRGQLTVYLRLLDVPLPSVYGPSADANPFR